MRSNYFAVHNAPDFIRLCERWGLLPIQDENGLYGFLGNEDTDLSCDFFAEQETGTLSQQLAALLADNHVAVVIEVASDHMRFLAGAAWAVNGSGEERTVNLDEIYQRAETLGVEVTRADY